MKNNIYKIDINDMACGFFANYRHVLEYLYVADKFELTPYIYFSNCIYKEDKPVNGTDNPYEYYFLQPAISELDPSNQGILVSNITHMDLVGYSFTGTIRSYQISQEYIETMAEIQKKYVKLNSNTEDYIKNGIFKSVYTGRILGVHARGTDFRVGYKNHPEFIETQLYFEIIDTLLQESSWDGIFLATDDSEILEQFKNKYGSLLIFYEDVMRSSGMKSVAFQECNRKQHKYKLGLEVIRDVYTISHCSGFIGGISQVAICARIIKQSRTEKFEELHIIEKRIREKGLTFSSKPTQLSINKKDNDEDNLKKYKEFYKILTDWLSIKQNDGSLVNYFKVRGYERVSIQGWKELGKLLFRELSNSGIRIEYIIDRNLENCTDGCLSFVKSVDAVDSVDVIIVTAVHYFDEIKKDYLGCDIPIVSLFDIIDEITATS